MDVALPEEQTEVAKEQTEEGTDLALTETPLEETQAAADESGTLTSNDGRDDVLVRFADPGSFGLQTKTYAQPLDQKDMKYDWYVVNKNITFDERMTVEGTVNLILCNNTTLTANEGIEIKDGAILSIWVQSFGNKMGKLVAKASGGNAGIGGNEKSKAGTVQINGGNIQATGGSDGEKGGAGIGAGSKEKGKLTIADALMVTASRKGVKEIPHNTAAHLAVPFPTSAACRFLDLPPVNLRHLLLADFSIYRQ